MALFVGALGFAACSDDDNTSTDPGEGGGNTKPEVSVLSLIHISEPTRH